MPGSPYETPAPDSGFGLPVVGTGRYGAAVAITAFAVLSQYFVPQTIEAMRPLYASAYGDLFVVYGVPIIAFLALVGVGPLRRAFVHPVAATVQGLRWYGALSIVSLVVALTLAVLYMALDPEALKFLLRPNPALRSAASDPWFWVGFSFAIGLVEEVIFRGWIFGYWLARGTPSWPLHAVWTSGLFAGVHAYYGITYGPVSPIPYAELFLLGLAFACIVRYSGGNLIAPILLHGAHDATAFLTLVNPIMAAVLQWGLVLLGGLVALIYALSSGTPPPEPMSPAMENFPPQDPYAFIETGRFAGGPTPYPVGVPPPPDPGDPGRVPPPPPVPPASPPG